MTRRARKTIGWSLFAAFWVVAGFLLLRSPGTGVEKVTLPSPNGYDHFLRAGELAKPIGRNASSLADDELAAMIATNRAALDEVRLGLSLECRVPPVTDIHQAEQNLRSFGHLKVLAQVMAAGTEWARRQADWDQTLAMATNGVRFGNQLGRGGLLIDRMVANAALGIALSGLKAAVASLPSPVARAGVQALLVEDSAREPLSAVAAREERFARTMHGIRGRLVWLMVGRKTHEKVMKSTEAREDALTRDLRGVVLQLAARAYEADRGTLPKAAADLVPAYLRELPRDPANGQPLDLPLGSAAP